MTRIRYTTPPRLEWKERVGDRWIGRTLTVNRKNLEQYGIPAPAGEPTAFHARRLQIAVEHAIERLAQHGHAKLTSQLADVIDTFLDTLRCSYGFKRRIERALRAKADPELAPHLRAADISLLTFLGNIPFHAVTSEHLLQYQNFLQDAGYSPMSVRGFLRDIRSLFIYGVRHGYLESNPAEKLRIPANEPRTRIHFLTKDQVEVVMKLAGDPLAYDANRRFHLEKKKDGRRTFLPTPGNNVISQVLLGFLYLGVRRSELARIEWSDVNLLTRVVAVRGARKNPTKSERTRLVPIPEQLHAVLVRKPRTSKYVFTNSNGEGWTSSALSSCLRHFKDTYGKALGFKFDFQSLRRTYGSILYHSGYSLDQVAEFLGHSDVNTTRTWYVSLRAEEHHERVTAAFR